MKLIKQLDQDLSKFLKSLRDEKIQTQVPKILEFMEEKCKFGLNLDKINIQYAKSGSYYGMTCPKNYKAKNSEKGRIVLKINLGVHHTTEQLFDTCAHEYVHMVQILIFHALVDEGSITGHGKVFFRIARKVNNPIKGLNEITSNEDNHETENYQVFLDRYYATNCCCYYRLK